MFISHMPVLSIRHLQYLSLVGSASAVSLCVVINQSTTQKYKDYLLLANIFCFTAHFGSQIWVSIFAGLITILNLPRYWFGQLQKRMFPIFFCYGSILSSWTLTTFTSLVFRERMTHSHWKMVMGLSASLCISTLNLWWLSPVIVDLMELRFKLEKDTGLDMKIGFVDMSPMDTNEEYQHVNKKFRFYHMLNGLTNMIGLFGNFVYMYCLISFIDIK